MLGYNHIYNDYMRSLYEQYTEKQFNEAIDRIRQQNTQNSSRTKPFTIEDLLRQVQSKTAPSPSSAKSVSREQRMKDIETELDIIRGVVPTPKGYTVDPSKVKSLMKELKELKGAN